jgi:hypothetical protein
VKPENAGSRSTKSCSNEYASNSSPFPSEAGSNIVSMFGAEIICSDEHCAVTVDVVAESAEAFASIACDGCGCATQVLAVWEVIELRPAAPVIALRPPKPPLAA